MAKAAGFLDRVQGRMEDFFAPESGMGVPNLPPDQSGMMPGEGAPMLGAIPEMGAAGGLGGEAAPAAGGAAVPAPSPESTLGGLTEGQAPPELGQISLGELMTLGLNSFLEQLLLQPTDTGGAPNAEGTAPQAQGPSPQEGLQGPTGV